MDYRTRLRALVYSIGLALPVIVCSCADSDTLGLRYGPAQLDHGELLVRPLPAPVVREIPALGLPTDIAVVGQYVALLDIASDSVLHFLDARTGLHVVQLARRGEGPGEFKMAWSLDPMPGDTNLLWIYDIELRRMTLVDVTTSIRERRLVFEQLITLSGDALPTGPLWSEGGGFGSLGLFTGGRIAYFDADGNHTTTVGQLPPGAGSVSPSVRQHAYRATLVRHPSGTRMAAATRHASTLQYFEANGTHIADIEGPLEVRPKYRIARNRRVTAMQTGQDLRFGYVDATAADGGIYALFSGRTREGYRRDAVKARFVHVFDWEGNFQIALRTAADLLAIAVDSEGRTLYAVRHDPVPAVEFYDLNAVFEEEPVTGLSHGAVFH